MDTEKKEHAQRSSTWIWLSADGARWRINRTSDGVWSCPIGTGGKRVGPWERGLPPSLGSWPGQKNQE